MARDELELFLTRSAPLVTGAHRLGQQRGQNRTSG